MIDEQEPDPVDAELIAYLDGELEATDARRIEDRLDGDPKLRARAEALKRSYDLLDFLPKPEPSPTFATRTMDKLPVSGSAKPVSATASHPMAVPVGMSSLALSGMTPHRTVPTWIWAVSIFISVGVAIGIGYLGTAAARSYFRPPPSKEPSADSLSVADLRIIENLPLYASVDDLEFLNQLATSDFFGDELAPPEGLPPVPPVEADKPSGKQFDELFKAFRELPPDRLEKIRMLDQQIHAQEPAKRDRSYRLLEAYAAWLQRLAEADRKEILAATTSEKRLEAIREVQRKQWIAYLSASQRKQLKDQPADVKAGLIAKWKAEEEKNREAWSLAKVQWDAVRTGKQPWPFMEERMKKDVFAYVVAVYHPDDLKHNRLSASGLEGGDAARLKEAMDRADKGEWVLLGKTVYDFSKKYETLPEPGKGNPVTEFADLAQWPVIAKLENRPKAKKDLDARVGKWPEFALAVHSEMIAIKVRANVPSRHLGPCRPDDFKDDVRRFLPVLKGKSTDAEWTGLKALEDKWPEYPRELLRLSKIHDLSVPGSMPPGSPSLWENTYNPPRKPMPRPGG